MDEARSSRILEAELFGVLAQLAPDEAGLARSYVESGSSAATRLENPFGIAGGGVEFLIGRWSAAVIAGVAGTLLDGVEDPDLRQAATGVKAWLGKRFGPGPALSRDRVRAHLVETLVREGFDRADAVQGAGILLASGERAAGTLLDQSVAGPVRPAGLFPPGRLQALREVLCTLYPGLGEVRIVIDDVGMDPARIVLTGTAEQIWYAVLDEARKHGLVGAIVDRARKDYPTNEELVRVANKLGFSTSA